MIDAALWLTILAFVTDHEYDNRLNMPEVINYYELTYESHDKWVCTSGFTNTQKGEQLLEEHLQELSDLFNTITLFGTIDVLQKRDIQPIDNKIIYYVYVRSRLIPADKISAFLHGYFCGKSLNRKNEVTGSNNLPEG